jgi:ribonuclease BN (tRNA processing enzyme)
VLLECGAGSLVEVARHLDLTEKIDAVVLSHLHADHMADCLVLQYARLYAQGEPLPIYAPAEPEDMFAFLTVPGVTEGRAVGPGLKVILGGLDFQFGRGEHMWPSLSVRIKTPGGRIVFYTGDSRLTDDLVKSAAQSNVLVSESSFLEAEKGQNKAGHMSARDAGRLAADARAEKLVLTHLWPKDRPEELLAEASREFSGEIEVARPGMVLEVG